MAVYIPDKIQKKLFNVFDYFLCKLLINLDDGSTAHIQYIFTLKK